MSLHLFLRIRSRLANDRGSSAVEYAFLIALIACVCIMATQYLGHATSSIFDQVGSSISDPGVVTTVAP